MVSLFTATLNRARHLATHATSTAPAFPLWVLITAALLIGGCQTVPPTEPAQEQSPPAYALGPGDKIRVIVYQRKDLSGVFEVDSSGRVSLPLVRGIQAAGLTLPALEDAIIRRLKQMQLLDTKVSVDLIKSRPVCILGEVTKPGCFDYVYGMRATTVIAMAGGYTYRARQNNLKITRASGKSLRGRQDMLVFPGDVIEVEERLF